VKYIFVTGGVVSSLGKGLTAAALGTLLENRGLRIALQKFDPYLNVDPGTMNPYQHGEVYVLDDGAETDLDLGHYERFTSTKLTRRNSTTSGQVYQQVLDNERDGVYLGKTVQVIPHVTDEIQRRILQLSETTKVDVIMTEIGGTVGDIEGLPFLEAIREFALDVGPHNVCFIHVTYVPYIKAAGELKTKPTQQSVAKLREIGIAPHILVCRCEQPLNKELRQKLSMFCNVPFDAVIEEKDVEHSIYEVPLMLQRERLDDLVCKHLLLDVPPANMTHWQDIIRRLVAPQHRVRVGVVGKYTDLQDAYKSVYEALIHGGIAHDCRVQIEQIDAEEVEKPGGEKLLKELGGILVPGGFGARGIEGKIIAARFAREHKVPYLGLCLGMQVATIEFARNILGLKDANSTEFDTKTPDPVIHLQETQRHVKRKGGSMRLGAQECEIRPGTLAEKLYGSDSISERHRHRYEFNNAYREEMEKHGLVISGTTVDNQLVELVEIRNHPFFIACQFHPEFQSKPTKPHPLFLGFIAAAHTKQHQARIPGMPV
jgi:CTP synthase